MNCLRWPDNLPSKLWHLKANRETINENTRAININRNCPGFMLSLLIEGYFPSSDWREIFTCPRGMHSERSVALGWVNTLAALRTLARGRSHRAFTACVGTWNLRNWPDPDKPRFKGSPPGLQRSLRKEQFKERKGKGLPQIQIL